MYGMCVPRAVLKNREKISDPTIHHVIPSVDAGEVILQRSCPVSPGESPVSLAKKVHCI